MRTLPVASAALVGRGGWRRWAAGTLALALSLSASAAQDPGPRLPCHDMDPSPAYGAADATPVIRTWTPAAIAAPGVDADCGPWSRTDGQFMVALAGRFRSAESVDTILGHFGAATELRDIRYWSVTDRRWRPLVAAATALDAGTRSHPRRDFAVADWGSSPYLYMAQTDGRTGTETVYRMQLRTLGASTFALEMENINAVRWWGATLFAPGELRTVYVLRQSEPGVWSYYSLMTVGGARWMIAGHEGSYVNRAVAFYRHIAHIRTDLEPPAVR